MKYIRTEDGIYKIDKDISYGGKEIYKVCYHDFSIIGNGLQKADTIEELCDEFLVMDNGRCMEMFSNYDDLKNSGWYRVDFDIYGAIYTDKGLIYVAKLNDKGELELI